MVAPKSAIGCRNNMAAKRRTLRTILQSSASRKSFRFVSKDELTRVGLSPNTKLLVPKGLKRVTIKTATNKRAVRQERPKEFTALFIAKVQADVARGTSIKKAGGKNRGKFSLRE